jgi:hypothetical protein
MLGGDPILSKHLPAGGKHKFWTRTRSHADQPEIVQLVCATSAEQILRQFPELVVFDPDVEWQTEHEGQLFREYDLDKDSAAIAQVVRRPPN